MPVTDWKVVINAVATVASTRIDTMHSLWKRGIIGDEAFVGSVIALGKAMQEDVERRVQS